MIKTEPQLTGERLPGIVKKALPWSRAIRSIARSDACDIATIALIAALVVIALCTFKDYAISNDEGVQRHYGELIIAYYRSGFRVRDLLTSQNLYLYGGLFDITAVALAKIIPVEPYELRHVLCAMTGIGGVVASAAMARLIAGPRAGLIAAAALALCGAWYGAMFNHTKDIPFAAAMMGTTLFLVRMARSLPTPRTLDVMAFGLLAGAELGLRSLGLIGVCLSCSRNGCLSALARSRPGMPAFCRPLLTEDMSCGSAGLFHHDRVWPWAALSPLNPIRGLFAFAEFHYAIRTALRGTSTRRRRCRGGTFPPIF